MYVYVIPLYTVINISKLYKVINTSIQCGEHYGTILQRYMPTVDVDLNHQWLWYTYIDWITIGKC